MPNVHAVIGQEQRLSLTMFFFFQGFYLYFCTLVTVLYVNGRSNTDISCVLKFVLCNLHDQLITSVTTLLQKATLALIISLLQFSLFSI